MLPRLAVITKTCFPTNFRLVLDKYQPKFTVNVMIICSTSLAQNEHSSLFKLILGHLRAILLTISIKFQVNGPSTTNTLKTFMNAKSN